MTVVWSDGALVVVDKPAGLPTQAAKGGSDNLHDRLKAQHPYVGLHHRLDAAVSGLVLFTLDPSMDRWATDAFRGHAIGRRYVAVASGLVASGTWERPVGGRDARTVVEALASKGGLTALRLLPTTGRKHQLRIHAALAGSPLVGDRRYGGTAARMWPRLALHAERLVFVHPKTGATHTLHSRLPEDLAPLLERLLGQRYDG